MVTIGKLAQDPQYKDCNSAVNSKLGDQIEKLPANCLIPLEQNSFNFVRELSQAVLAVCQNLEVYQINEMKARLEIINFLDAIETNTGK